jgi:hypothetical protein
MAPIPLNSSLLEGNYSAIKPHSHPNYKQSLTFLLGLLYMLNWEFKIEARMSWASKHTASRGEDNIYALFGIIDVFMPTVYEEGS